MTRRRATDVVLASVLLAAAFLAFRGTLACGFVWDDLIFVRDNRVLEDLRNIPRIIVSGDSVGTYLSNPYYRPVATVTFALDSAAWGDDPFGFHLTNLLLHLAACLALYATIRLMRSPPVGAFLAALLFAVHPAHSEPVAYVSARADLICALFMLVSFACHLKDAARRSHAWRVASYGAFLVAIFAKITAGVLMPLIAVHFLAQARRPGWWKDMLPYAVIAAFFLAVRNEVVEMSEWSEVPFVERLASAGPFLVEYFRNALFPTALKVFYDLPFRGSFADPAVVGSWAAVAAAVAGIAFLFRRAHRDIAFGLTWFLAGLLPVCGIVIVLVPAHLADRYLYVPLIGLAIAIGAVARILAEPEHASRFRVAAPVAAACAVALAVTASGRIGSWRDSGSYWRAAAADAPRSAYVLNNLGNTLRTDGRFDEAVQALEGAVAISDIYAEPHINLAAIAIARHDLDAAERNLRRALELWPEHPVVLNMLGVTHAEQGLFGEARACFEEAIRIWPGYRNAIANLARMKRVSVLAEPSAVAVD